MSAVRVLFCGDARGNIDALMAKIGKVNASNGPFDAVFCTGTFFEPLGSEKEEYSGQLEPYLEGKKQVPVPVYCIGGIGRGSHHSVARLQGSHGITYLGRQGVTSVCGLKVAFLDGQYNAAAYTAEEESEIYYSKKGVEKLKNDIMGMEGDLDILLTIDWPEGILSGVSGSQNLVTKVSSSGPVAELALLARPRYHIAASHNVYIARMPYINEDKGAGKHVTRFIGLGYVGNTEKQKWIQALALVPSEKMELEQFSAIPQDATKCPFSVYATKKRSAEEATMGEQPWRWQDNAKKHRLPMAAPSYGRQDIVKDRLKTIFVRNVPFGATEDDLIAYFSSAGKVVDLVRRANKEGKLNTFCHVQFSSKEEMERACQMNEQELMGRQLFIEPASVHERKKDAAPVEGCWFCLSNPNADVNLVCSVGQESYVALDKGPIDTTSHVLVLPIEHHACSLDLPSSALDEIDRYISALSSYFASQGKAIVGFERFMRLKKSGGNHCHINMIGMSMESADTAKSAFINAAKQQGHSFTQVQEKGIHATQAAIRDIVGDGEYFCAILPDGSRLVHPIQYGERHPLSFGRDVLATLMGTPERADWKLCKVSAQDETENAEKFKSNFKPYDIMYQ